MPSPEELRRALHEEADAASPAPVDLGAVLSSSRARRRRRGTAVIGTAAAVLVVAAAGGTALTIGLQQPATTTADAPLQKSEGFADASQPADGEGVAPADEPPTSDDLVLVPVDRLNPCGAAPLGPTPVAADGLALTATLLGGLEAGGTGRVLVTITNTGDSAFSGELLGGPAVTLSDETTLWHTSGLAAERAALVLAPGASARYETEVRAVRCSPDDEAGLALPTELPAVSPGAYGLSAAVAVAAPDAPLGAPLVSSRVEVVIGAGGTE